MAQELALQIPGDAIQMAMDHGQLGPAMRALNPQQRVFVYGLVELGGNATGAAAAAGYGQDSPTLEQRRNAQRVRGYQLSHDPKVLAAIKEEAEKRLNSGALIAASALLEMVTDPLSKFRYKAAVELLNRSGLIVETQHRVTVEHTGSDKEMIDRIKQLAGGLGIDPVRLLGSAGVIIDADFTEVTPAQTSTAGLEDIL